VGSLDDLQTAFTLGFFDRVSSSTKAVLASLCGPKHFVMQLEVLAVYSRAGSVLARDV
jgi:hypothetical protein